jgi:serine/threonine-protein kinase
VEAAAHDPLIGQMVGSYRIEGLVGSGGMGRVYVATHPDIGSRVAIKVLSRDCAGRRDLVERFFDEARMVGRIRHDGIVRVLDLTVLPDGRPVIVMDLLDGEPLSALVARMGRLQAREAVRLGVELLDALAAAHEAGVIHRDLKPDNVFVTRQGRVVVLDFGIAKLVPELSQAGASAMATTTGSLLGTPAFMSPEQIMGRAATAATDVYAVGVILYQALCGRLPFEGGSLFDLLQKHVSAAPPALAGDVPAGVAAVVLRALAKEPRDRYGGARDMAAALVQAVAAPAVAAPAVVAAAVAPRRTRVWPWIGAGSLALVVVVVLVLVSSESESESGSESGSGPDPVAEPVSGPGPGSDAGTREIVQAPTPSPSPSPTPTPSPSPTGTPRPKPSTSTSAGLGSGVTIINTADLAREKTGLDKIVEKTKLGDAFDPFAYTARAQALARRLFPDAGLTRIDIEYMTSNGRAILKGGHDVTYRFRSAARSVRPAGVPQNVEVDIPCMVHVWVSADGVAASPVTDEECDEKVLPAPRCGGAALWKKAFPKGTPKPGDWAARISLLPDGWFFSAPGLGEAPDDDLDVTLPDDC